MGACLALMASFIAKVADGSLVDSRPMGTNQIRSAYWARSMDSLSWFTPFCFIDQC